ncbi:MAG: ATP-binding cassette domain-containing protein, partial [Anaerolineaceae bacterium]|nr:ATP-binding cassette domain-containing protein [Anaerolineaceae bacterium]
MAIVSLKNVSLTFGGPILLQDANLQIERGEKVGLLGRNGAGKSTLLRLIHGEINPDNGEVSRQQQLRSAHLLQAVPKDLAGSVRDIIAAGLGSYHFTDDVDEEEWQREIQVEQMISKFMLDGDSRFDLLSSGMKRRVLLAKGFVRNPDLLLLDEPTNHLDIDAIDWLEQFLKRWGGTLLFITHDRMFLDHISSRIVELDRGELFDWNCDYKTFRKRKETMIDAQEVQNEEFDKKLAQEEKWIRRGLEARRTRNMGRVRSLERLRRIRQERREQPGKVRLQIQKARRSGELVVEAKGVCFSYEDQKIISEFSTTIMRGDRVGFVGPNGSGKTTLLRLLIGELNPRSGNVRLGTNIEIAYFDQLRAQLDESQSILENVG